MNKLLLALLIVAIALLGVDTYVTAYNYGAEQAAMQVVECIKDPEGCDLDPSDAPDFAPDDRMVPASLHHRT